ncbi:MAG: cryptochrome/photolyase family protein [bacterium]
MGDRVGLVWFRNDLRLADNPALCDAAGSVDRLVTLYIDRGQHSRPAERGSARRVWLHHSLQALNASLVGAGNELWVSSGEPFDCINDLLGQLGITDVFWNEDVVFASRAEDALLKSQLQNVGLDIHISSGGLLHDPENIRTANGHPYRVFGAFWRNLSKSGMLFDGLAEAPGRLPPPAYRKSQYDLEELGLLSHRAWEHKVMTGWTPGEQGALQQLQGFLSEAVGCYANDRDYPAKSGVSRLSPHLAFGELSVQRVVHTISCGDQYPVVSAESYVRELGWREFGRYLMHHFPDMSEAPLDRRWEAFQWRSASDAPCEFRAWQMGRTGYPLIDAGMRELWSRGWMHNRVRMVVASFLVKNLGIDWLDGANWFEETLVDADHASNRMGWQWVAGCGVDAAPYYRVFNPVLQGKKFDPRGDYVRRWIPELAGRPSRTIHEPIEAPAGLSALPGMNDQYVAPIVDLSESRTKALDRWKAMREVSSFEKGQY